MTTGDEQSPQRGQEDGTAKAAKTGKNGEVGWLPHRTGIRIRQQPREQVMSSIITPQSEQALKVRLWQNDKGKEHRNYFIVVGYKMGLYRDSILVGYTMGF